jgi:hypothetical protein
MTKIVTKQQLDHIIDKNKVGNYIAIDNGKWIALKSTEHTSKCLTTDCIIKATRFLLNIEVK